MRRTRLDKLLSENGLSRKQAGQVIRAGRVRVDGEVVRDAAQTLDADTARVTLDGEALSTEKHLHLMLNKPAGYLTATEDGRGETVMDLLPEPLRKRGLGPVGRLDKDVTGLILLTTDGQLAHRLISPKWKMDKRYLAAVEGRVDEACVRRFAEGVPLKDFTCEPAGLHILRAGDEESLCEVTVHEGKYHQVKRMLAACGHPVLALSRRSIAGIELDKSLGEGEWRYLTEEERASLYRLTELEEG